VSGSRKRKKKLKRQLPLKRRDMITRMLVDIGIFYAPTLGNASASEFLRQKEVPEHVIVRVMHAQQSSIFENG
jgi:hypothetical protein